MLNLDNGGSARAKSPQRYYLLLRSIGTLSNLPLFQAKTKGSLGSISDVTVIRSASHPNPSQVTHCKWWRTWSGEDYGVFTFLTRSDLMTLLTTSFVVIIASFSGSLRFVNVRSHEVTRIKTKHPIVKIDLMIDPGKSFKYLIIHTHQGGYWQLPIERKAAFNSYESIVTPGSTSKFEPQPLTRFNKPGLRLVRQVSRGSPFVGTDSLDVFSNFARLN